MANLTPDEFQQAVTLLADAIGVQRLRDRLGHMNAFTSRRGLNTATALAERLYRLSGGLRLRVPATFAFTTVWTEMVHQKIGEDEEKAMEALADAVNACLGEDDAVKPGQEAELDRALAAYREKMAAVAGPEVARLDMLLKAVPAVAERVRTTTAAGA